jgi:hypothetical protein
MKNFFLIILMLFFSTIAYANSLNNNDRKRLFTLQLKKASKSSSNRWKTKKISGIYLRRILPFHIPFFLNTSTCNT